MTITFCEIVEKDYVFRGPTVRRMTAEQFVDAVATLTGNWKPSPANKIEFDGANLAGVTGGIEQNDLPKGKWIWSTAKAAEGVEPGTSFFRKSFELPDKPTTADVIVVAANSFVLLVNQRNGTAGKNWEDPKFRNLAKRFKQGENIVTVLATHAVDLSSTKIKPGGCLQYLPLQIHISRNANLN